MKLRKGEWFIAIFTFVYLIAFFIYYFGIRHYEFMWYIFVVGVAMALIILTLRRTNFDYAKMPLRA